MLLLPFGGAMALAQNSYAEGQIWEYHTRPSDEGSLLKIQKIELIDGNGGTITVYHISVIGAHFKGKNLAGEVTHLPVSRKTLDDSVTRLSEKTPVFPDPTEGIAVWREANGGVFTITLAEIMDLVETTFVKRVQEN